MEINIQVTSKTQLLQLEVAQLYIYIYIYNTVFNPSFIQANTKKFHSNPQKLVRTNLNDTTVSLTFNYKK